MAARTPKQHDKPASSQAAGARHQMLEGAEVFRKMAARIVSLPDVKVAPTHNEDDGLRYDYRFADQAVAEAFKDVFGIEFSSCDARQRGFLLALANTVLVYGDDSTWAFDSISTESLLTDCGSRNLPAESSELSRIQCAQSEQAHAAREGVRGGCKANGTIEAADNLQHVLKLLEKVFEAAEAPVQLDAEDQRSVVGLTAGAMALTKASLDTLTSLQAT